MAYNPILNLGGGGTALLTSDNVWTGTNQYDNDVNFTSGLKSTNTATADDDIPNLGTVKDIAAGGLIPKTPVKVVASINVPLTGLYSIDNTNGESIPLLEGDNVCVKAQTNPLENGRYVAHAGGSGRARSRRAPSP